ncbi:Neural cell adhesion molecule 1 [Hondaea fermentalgiana]|uniref:Neural cell adhesion molecule 1 n=1 Tax=Hondaea fermentalgiana TaxID=2315210 RepID=A0A2R5G923_9STRA|nr:Neural cell adhesion molecule 1 [Hondaea fermentalgiana]|eukprot:GBG27547.1 Neural cell adhesion molecule 1 [Hondaea fermentalgiana]
MTETADADRRRPTKASLLAYLLTFSAVPALQKEGARVLAGTSQRCDDETYEGDLFAQRVLQRPTNRLLVKTEGSATSNVAEIQELQLWSHQVIDVTVSGAQLTGGTFALEFCTFDVQLPGTVDLAPIPGDGSDDLILVTVDDDEDVATSWENFGVYSGYPIRISTDETTETQDRAVYRIYYTECDNCDGDVMQLDRDYQGTTIRRGGGAVWGCSWDLPQTQLSYAAGTSAMEAAFENALGSGAVESVTRTAIDENLGQGFIYRVTLAKGVVGVHARVDSSNLRGESISVNATEVVRGAEEDATFASETERTDLEGSYTLGFDGEDTTSLAVTSSALQVKNALADLPGIGPNVAVTKGSDGWTWQVTFNDEAGDIADLATTILSDSTPGLTLKVETVRVGLATLDGEFELVLASTNASITVSATETDTNMRSLLRSGLGLSDVSVKRTGPSESNGFEWEIGLTGDCPDEFDPDDDELYITPTCDVEVMPGPRTASLLLGNDATLTVTNLVAVDLAGTWGGESVSWREVSRTPTSLPASTTSNGHYYLPVESNQRGRYAFEAVSSSDSSTVVGTELVFVDAASPNASVGEALAVSYPTDWIEITGNASSARFGSSIASYAWTLKSKPASASASAGQIRYPTAKTTTVSNLNVPGTFQYQLRVTDSLGLTSCALKSVNVLFAPSIDQPLQGQDIVPGNDLVLNCTASGSTPLSYTWNFKDVTLDVPSTTSVLVLPEVTETDQGNYSCSVTNEVSTIQSNSVWVNVYNPVEIVSSPSPTVAAPGSSATLSCAATATFPVNVTWQRRDFGDTTWSTYSTQRGISGTEDVASSFTLTLTQTSEDNEGEYRCVVANIVGNASSASAMLDILDLPSNVSLTVEPESVLVDGIDEDGKGSFRLSCSALGQNLSFAFARSGAIIANQVDSLYVSNVTAAKDAGEYTCVVTNGAGSVSSEGLEIVVNTPPIIVEQPTSLVVQPGDNVTLDVQATGARPLEYLWKKDGQFIREERSALRNLTFTSVAESDQGSYSVVVYNHLGHAESVSVTLDVDDPPQIVSPLGETTVRVDPGETAQLRCVANGTGTLSFMWYEVLNATANTLTRVVRGRETSGANWTELALYSVTNDDDRAYHCLATSDLGEALSPAIILDVNDPPSITLNPLDTFAEPGATVILQVEASGAEPISFQWRKDGAPISGATARIIILRNVSAADEGSYDCRATNHLSPVTGALSEVGELRLARAPEIVTAPQQETYVDPTSTATLRCAFSGAPPMTYKWLYRSAGADDLILQQNETDEAYVESVFTIPSTVESDQGTYVLLAENRLGNVTSSAAELYINDPPVITSERVSKLVDPGANVSFTCAVTADPAVESVTWKRRPTSGSSGDVVLSGQTSLTIEIAAAQQENEGQYVCLAVNSAGSAEKVVGILDVRDPPTIVRMEPVAEGGILTVDPLQSVTLSAVATGLEPLSYNWTLNGEVAQMGTGSNFTFVPSEAGYVYVRVTNQLGFDVSTPIQIAINAPAQVDSVTISPANGRIIPGGSAELLCRGSGSTPLSFSWLKDGDLVESTVDPVGADATVNASEVPRFVVRESDDYSSLLQVLDADVATHSGSYSCRVRNSALPAGTISSPLDLEVVVAPLLRATKPEDITRLPGTNSTFKCETVAGTGPFEIRWFYTETLGVAAEEIAMWNSSLFEDAIGTYQPNASAHELILVIPNASDDDEGLYSCEVCNEGGCAQSRWANLGVSDAPRIVEQIPSGEDASIVANPGEMVTLSVEASGLEPLGFQWYKYDNSTDAMVLVEVDGDAYHLEPESCSEAGVPCKLVMDEVSNDQAGSYHCVVSNSLGMTSSVLVSLSVTVRPLLADETTWPSSLVTACPGNEFEQEVELVGTRPMLIEWYFSATFAGTTSIFTTEPVWQTTEAVFRISDPEYSNEGYYAFIATNVAGTLRSEIARLEVNEGPSAAADATGASPRHPVTLPQTFTRLYGTASKNAVSYTWELLSSPDLGTGRVQLLTPLAASTDVLGLTIPGAYVFQLTVVGSNGCYSTDTVSVTVNTAPIPVVFDATISLGNSPAELDASNSYDADAGGSIISFNWNVAALDGSVELAKDVALTGNDTAIVSLSYPAVGLYELVLTVTDNDGATSSQRVTLNVLDIKFLSPSSPFAAPFILGSCFEHLIVVDIEGTLTDGDDTTFRLAFTTSNETTTAESPTLVSSQLRSLEGASMTSAGAQVVYMWSVGHRVMAGTGYLEVVVGTNARTRTSSEMFEVILPYRFAITDEGDCDCAATPSRSQTIRCIGFGQDSSASGESCAWYETCIAEEDSCFVGELRRLGGQSIEAEADDETCVAVIYRETPTLCFDTVSGYLLSEDDCASSSLPSVDESLACSSIWFADAWSCDRATNLAWRNVTCVDSVTFASSESCDVDSRPPSGAACVGTNRILEDDEQLISNEGWFRWRLGTWGECLLVSESLGPSICPMTQRSREVFWHSCVARATLEGSLGLADDDNVTFWSDAQKHLIASQVLANVLNASLPAASSWTLLGLQVIQTQERRVLVTRDTIEDNSLEVVADVEMYASSELQWPTIDNASSWSELSASAFNIALLMDAASLIVENAIVILGQCIPLSWVPVAASDTMGAGGNDDETNATIVTVVRKVQVFWPGFLLGLFLLCASLACVGAWFRRRERRLRKEAELRRRRRQVFADPTDDDDDEFLSEKEIKPTLRPRESPEARSLGKGRPRGWLWKRSRNGFDGQQVWQQWYASKHDSELYYYDCDLGEAWSEAGGSGPIERGRLSLDRVEAVMVKGKKSAKYGGWRFDLVLRAFSSVKRADEEENGLRRDVSDDEDDDGENGSLARETVDVLDFPQVKSRDMKETAAKADARIRIEFMCESRHDAHTWAEAIAKTSGARLRIGRGGGLGSGLKPTNEERVKIDLSSVASSSIASAQSSGTSVSGVEGLMVGSFSGAVGDRVACEGWIRLEKEKRSVYGVLFPQRDELAVFGRMMPAQDGAHHYADKLHSVSLAHVVSVSEMGLSNSIELIFWDGKRFSFVASSQAKDMWRSTLRRHMKFVHGVNAEATKPPGAERPPRITEESRPESEDVAESPHTPAPKDLYAVNEPLSSLRVRRSSSVSAGRAGKTAHVSGCREEVEAATSSISVKKNPRDCTPPLRPAPTTAARTRGSKLGPALGSHTRDIENKNNSSNKNRFTTTTTNNSRGGGDRDIAHNVDVDDDEAAAALIDMQVV